ncbi:MAG: ferrous iron transport protein B [bacterium]
MSAPQKKVTIALAGNPNVGKTAVINMLAGTRLKVGNWPGVTVSKKEAQFEHKNSLINLIDLPGIYSLNNNTAEEKITLSYLTNNKPDLILNIIDSSNLERNLYLTTQLCELGIPVIIVLNMYDEAQAAGIAINTQILEHQFGVSVTYTTATKESGKQELLQTIDLVIKKKFAPKTTPFSPLLQQEIKELAKIIQPLINTPTMPVSWLSTSLIEGNQSILEQCCPTEKNKQAIITYAQQAEQKFTKTNGESPEALLAEERYTYIATTLAKSVTQKKTSRKTVTETLDKLLLNRILGLPFFFLILYIVFKITFDGSQPFTEWIDGFIAFISQQITSTLGAIGFPHWFLSLISDGFLGGVGLVLSFTPLLLFLYFFLALLEESGYMTRAAFIMDRLMSSIGLHGKAFIPLLIGFGCNVPAVYATRTLETEEERKLTTSILSFMSCGAKLPIYALFTALFFPRHQALIILGLYILGLTVAITWGLILQKTTYKKKIPLFVMEMPPYRFPSFPMLMRSISSRLTHFITEAGKTITLTMLVLWALLNLPYGVPPENTILGTTARIITPIFRPLGFGDHWENTASIIPGFLAKEVVIGSLGQLYTAEQKTQILPEPFMVELANQIKELGTACFTAIKNIITNFIPGIFIVENDFSNAPHLDAIRKAFTPLSALCFMTFNLLLVSCITVMGAIKQEFGGKHLAKVLLLTSCTAYTVTLVINILGKWKGY